MPQISHAYAAGKVRALERTLLNKAALERLISAPTCEDVAHVLTESEWGEARTKQDVEFLAAAHVREACHLLRDCSAEPEITDCFLLKYDILNLKLLLKARMLGESHPGLSDCGTLSSEMLKKCVDERNYLSCPAPLRAVMERIEKYISVTPDPLYVDQELDKAYAAFIVDRMAKTTNAPIKAYFDAWAEMSNLLIALRSASMKKGSSLAAGLLLPGGTLPKDVFLRIADEPDRAYASIQMRPYAGHLKEALSATGKDALTALERQADNYLLSLVRSHRFEPTSIFPPIGYLLAREREAAAVRLIVTAKAANVKPERIEARLRELYA